MMIAKPKRGAMVADEDRDETAVADDSITIENLGAIEHVEIPAHPGTVVVLRGSNGCGKSTALSAISSIVDKKPLKVTKREGAGSTEKAFARGFGVTLKLATNGAMRRMDDLVVAGIEDDFDLDTLVDPGVQDPAAADMRRIKALCNVVDATVSLEALYELVGGREEFEAVVSQDSLAIDDPIKLVEKVKRDFEAASRLENSKAENAHAAAVAKLAENDGIDLAAPCDSKTLGDTLESAVDRYSTLREQRNAWDRVTESAESARKQLEHARTNYIGPKLTDLLARRTSVASELESQVSLIAELEQKLQAAQTRKTALESDLKSTREAIEAAESHESSLAAWQESIDKATGACPVSDAELEAASEAVEQARAAVERGTQVRDAIKRRTEAEEKSAEAERHRLRSERFREAAKGTLDVLAESVKAVSNRITFDSEFRLVTAHPIRKSCYFHDLSMGEKYALALDLVIETARRTGKRTVAKINQEAWEALDGANRQMVLNKVHGTQVTVYTAEASREGDPSGLTYQVL